MSPPVSPPRGERLNRRVGAPSGARTRNLLIHNKKAALLHRERARALIRPSFPNPLI